jgi:hypothetical protein
MNGYGVAILSGAIQTMGVLTSLSIELVDGVKAGLADQNVLGDGQKEEQPGWAFARDMVKIVKVKVEEVELSFENIYEGFQ